MQRFDAGAVPNFARCDIASQEMTLDQDRWALPHSVDNGARAASGLDPLRDRRTLGVTPSRFFSGWLSDGALRDRPLGDIRAAWLHPDAGLYEEIG